MTQYSNAGKETTADINVSVYSAGRTYNEGKLDCSAQGGVKSFGKALPSDVTAKVDWA